MTSGFGLIPLPEIETHPTYAMMCTHIATRQENTSISTSIHKPLPANMPNSTKDRLSVNTNAPCITRKTRHPGRRLRLMLVALLVPATFWLTQSVFAQNEDKPPPLDVVAVVPREFPPQYSVTPEGQPTGFAIDVMDEIATIANLRITYVVEETWAAVNQAVVDGRADLIPNNGITAERLLVFDFTAPVETIPVSIFLRRSTTEIQSSGDLAAHVVAAVETNIGVSLLQERGDVQTIVYPDVPGALFALLAGEADALIYPAPAMWKIARSTGVHEHISAIAEPVIEIKRAISVRKGNPELLERLNLAVAQFVDTEEYRELYVKWYGEPEPFWTATRVAWIMGGLLLVALFTMLAWRFSSIQRLNHQLMANIAEREQAEKTLANRELYFSSLMHDIREDILVIDQEYRVVDINNSFIRSTGRRRDDALERYCYEVSGGIGAPCCNRGRDCALSQIFETGEPRGYRQFRQRMDGTQAYVDILISPLKDAKGRITHVIESVRDITDLHVAQRSLQSSEKRYRELFDLAPDGVYVLDANGVIGDCSQSTPRLLGRSRSDIVGQHPTAFLDDAGRQQFREDWSTLMQRQSVERQTHIITGNDEKRVVWRKVHPLVSESGEVTGALVYDRDITESELAREALRQSETKYRELVELAQEGIWVIDTHSHTTFVNPSMACMLGYTPDEMLGKHLFDFMDAHGVEIATQQLEQRRLGMREEHEFEFLHKDGSCVHTTMATAAILDKAGEYVGAIAGVLDISRRKRAEDALRKRSQELEMLVEAGRQLSQTLDLESIYQRFHEWVASAMPCDGLIISSYDPVNEQIWCEFNILEGVRVDARKLPPVQLEPEGRGTQSIAIRTGKSLRIDDFQARIRENITSYHVSLDGDVVSPNQVPDDADVTRSAIITPIISEGAVVGAIQVLSYKLAVYSDDDLHLLESLASQIAVASNNARLYQQAREEIAERRRAEHALREAEERLRHITEQAPVSVWSTDTNLRLTYHSGAITEELALLMQQDQVLSHTLPELYESLLDEDTKRERMDQLQRALAGETVFYVHHTTSKGIENVISPLRDDANEIVGLVGIAIDITDKHRLEQQLRQSQRLEALGTLAGGVAHDFNNLLTSITGFTELILRTMPQTDPRYGDLVVVKQSAERGSTLTRQLLLFSRRQPSEVKSLNLSDTVTNLLKMLGRLLGEDVSIVAELESSPWITLGDTGQLEQVIMNLVVNARDAMPDGGQIVIKTENRLISDEYVLNHTEAEAGQHVCLSVLDTGVGMDAETIEHVFEPFFTTKAPGKGTGLGLAVVYGIVKQHGGWLDVLSEPGRGSVFNVFLPRASDVTPSQTERVDHPETLRGQGEHILIVEDEEVVRRFIGRALSDNGYRVTLATTLLEAREVFDANPAAFDLVFSDVILPDGNGVEFAQYYVDANPQLPIVFASGYTDARSKQTIIAQKQFQYLQKPYSLPDLLQAISKAFDARGV